MKCAHKKQICSFLRPGQEVVQLGLVNMQQQPDSSSCGLFAIAVATAITHGNNPNCCNWEWESSKMWVHLRLSLEKNNVNIIGYVDIGEVNNQLLKFELNLTSDAAIPTTPMPIASTVLTFMVRGLLSSLQQPYAKFPCHKLKGDLIFHPFWEAVC